MNKLNYFLILLLTSCAMSNNVMGHYFEKGKDFEYNLILNKNHHFKLNEKYFEAQSSCTGKWRFLSKDTILLECDTTENISEAISSGHMSMKNHKVVVLANHRLKFQQQILIKAKD